MLYKWPIIGHEQQVSKLENDLSGGNLSHAYLFVGPDKVGKFLVAKTLAGILQCSNNYCRRCPTCIQIEKGAHIDTIEIRDNGESIKIEEVRTLVGTLQMTAQSNYKIVLIDNIGRMTPDAIGSFLKTLEEPTSKTLFLMTANNLLELPSTIVSRARVMKFPSLSDKKLRLKIDEMKADLKIESGQEMIEKASMLSLGRPGKAIELLRDRDAMTEYLRFYNDIRSFFRDKDLTKRFLYVQGLAQSIADDEEEDNDDLDVFLEIFVHIARSLLNAKIESPSGENEDYPEVMRFSKQALLNLIHKIDETRYLIARNVNTKLALENLMLSF